MKNKLLLLHISTILILSSCSPLQYNINKDVENPKTTNPINDSTWSHTGMPAIHTWSTYSGNIQPNNIQQTIPENTIPKVKTTTQTGGTAKDTHNKSNIQQNSVGEEIENDEMIDDSLTPISGNHEESCIDAYNAYNDRMSDIRPEWSESVIEHLDIGIIPKLNHCVLGYKSSTSTFTYFAIIDLDDNDNEIDKFECIADYDVEKDTIIPCNQAKIDAVYKQYEEVMSDFIHK